MRNCPTCSILLTPVDYEGFRVLRCAQCGGHLVGQAELESIQAVALKSPEELKAEAAAGFRGGNAGRIRCPRCHMEMGKQTLLLPGPDLEMDVCRPCSLVWLDGGELALAQLGHEAGAGFKDAQTMKRRMAELEADPERKAAFEANLAAMPDEPSPLQEAVEDAVDDMVDDAEEDLLENVLEAILRNGEFRRP